MYDIQTQSGIFKIRSLVIDWGIKKSRGGENGTYIVEYRDSMF
jgi:hypothetical protein